MSQQLRRAVALVALFLISACADRTIPTEPPVQDGALGGPTAAPSVESADQARHQRFARRLALALRDPAFRAMVFQSLQRSPLREGKVHLQRFLHDDPDRLHRLAVLAHESDAAIGADLAAAEPMEIYLPVPAHRRGWRGEGDLLVATAEGDHDAPVAFDLDGNRRVLDPQQPPLTPVLALGRAEQAFEPESGPQRATGYDEDPDKESTGTAGSGSTESGVNASLAASPGLYMTYARINSTFEGWLKGAPEFEVHILGQDGSGNAMRTYQCAGESAGAPYQYNQDETEWRGNVMLFSQAQLDAYRAEHPGQALRILVLEDDDTRCVIKTDSARVARFFAQIAATYGSFTGGKDTLISVKTYRKAQSLFNLLKAFWSVLQSQDEIVGTAIEDSVANEYFAGANWIIKGENTVTYGALKLEMR